MTQEELNDIKRLVFKLNNKTFKEELFTFNFNKLKYRALVMIILGYEFENNEKMFNNIPHELVLSYKTDQKSKVTRQDVMLLSFFIQINVI